MTGGRILVAGVGNIFLGDDGFGSAVARKLADAALPDAVELVDVGIRGVHLAYQLMDGYAALILVDAIARGEPPGTLTVLDISQDDGAAPPAAAPMDAHGMTPDAVLALLRRIGAGVGTVELPARVLLVGVEPADTGEGIGLSPPVQAAVPAAAGLVRDLLVRIRTEADLPVGRIERV